MLNNVYCLMKGHEQEKIKAICINETCQQPLRRVCYKCLREELHQKERNFKKEHLVDIDKIQELLNACRQDLMSRLDQIEIQYLIQYRLAIFDIINALDRFYSIMDIIKQHKKDALQIIDFQEEEYVTQLIQNNLGVKQFISLKEQKVEQMEKKKVQYLQSWISSQFFDEILEKQQNNDKSKETVGKVLQANFKVHDQTIDSRLLSFKVFQNRVKDIKSLDTALCQFLIEEEKHTQQISRVLNKFVSQSLLKNPNNKELQALRCTSQTQSSIKVGQGLVEQVLNPQQVVSVIVPIQKNEEPSDQHFLDGMQFMEQRDYEKAANAFKKAIQIQQNFDFAYYQLGQAFFESKKYANAVEMFEKAIEINKKDCEYFINAGKAYLNLERYNEAIIMEDKALQLDPTLWYAYFLKARSYQLLKNYSSAIQIYHKSLEFKQDCPTTYYNLGQCYFEKKQYDLAVIQFKSAIELEKEDADYYIQYARALYELNDYTDLAIEMCLKAIKLDDKSFKPYFYLGLLNQQRNDLDEALKYYNKSLQINPTQSSSYNNKGNVLMAKKQYLEALRCFNQAIDLDPNEVLFYRNKGNCLLQADQNLEGEALKVFEFALQKAPDDENLLFGKGKCLLKLQKYDLSYQIMTKLININSKNCAYYYLHGLLLQQLQKFEQAIKSFDEAIKLKQSEIDFYKQKANCYECLKRFDLACNTYRRALQIEPDNRELKQSLGIKYRLIENSLGRQVNQQLEQLEQQLQSFIFRQF